MRRTLTIGLAALLAAACLIKDETHTIYLEPDGALLWQVLEQHVRSDVEDDLERQREEREFVEEARAGRSAVALAFDALGARSVQSRLLRDERPYSLLTTARFGAIDELAQRFLDALGQVGSVERIDEGSTSRFVMTIVVDEDCDVGDGFDVLLPLLDDAEDYRLLLTRGRFIDATGFRLLDGGTAAVPEAWSEEQIVANGGRATFSLTWIRE